MKDIIPQLGFGTFRLTGDTVKKAVASALEIGYRHIDTAQIYGNEKEVGEAIHSSGIPRKDLFITTKVWLDNLSGSKVIDSIEESLDKLKTDYVDLILVHWPHPEIPMEEYFPEMIQAKKMGLVKSIGVSNFTIPLLEKARLFLGTDMVLMNNQIEVHPYLPNNTLIDYCLKLGVSVTAYMPLVQGKILGEPILKNIALKYGKSEAQIVIAWLLSRGLIVIPASTNPHHQQANFEAQKIQIELDDIKQIERLKNGFRLAAPPFAPQWDN